MKRVHKVLATIELTIETTQPLEHLHLQDFLNEMDYGFQPTLFNKHFKLKSTEWVDTEIKEATDNSNKN